MIIPPSASPSWVKSELVKKQDKLTQGGGISISNNVVSVDLAEATQTSSGLMSAQDKKNLDTLKASEITEYIKTATAANNTLTLKDQDGNTAASIYCAAVTQTKKSDNGNYAILVRAGTGSTSGTSGTGFADGVSINPSAKAITASKFYGDLDGTASKATADGDGQNIASTYAKKGEIPDTSGLATKAELEPFAKTADLDKYALDTDLSAYLPLKGGTMTGTLIVNGGDGVGASKISLPKGKGQITDESTATIFGFNNSTELTIGHSSYALKLRGSGSRPTFNGSNLALASDVPDVSGFATKSEVSLLPTFEPQVVQSLPTSNISTKVMYLVPAENGSNDRYDQYIYVNNAWERIGSGMMTVDSAMSSTSTNPVQNKVIQSALAGKLSTTGTAAKATADASGNTITSTYATKTELGNKLDATGTAARATADASGNNIASTYAKKSELPTAGSNISISGTQISATDQKVSQVSAGGFDEDFPILLKTSPNTSTENGSVGFAPSVSINPKTGHITAVAFDGVATKAIGDADGNAIASTYAKKTEIPDISGLATKSALDDYLLKNGETDGTQTINGRTVVYFTGSDTPLTVKSSASATYLEFVSGSKTLGYYGVNASSQPVFYTNKDNRLAFHDELSNYFPLSGGTVSGLTKIRVTESDAQDSVLKVLSTEAGGWAGQWRGRLLVGAENKTFLMGVYNNICGIGAHGWTSANDGTGAAWEDIYINPDGGKTVYIGGHEWTHDTGILAIRNSDDKVLYNGKEIATKEDVATGGNYLPLTGGTLAGDLTISKTDQLMGEIGTLKLGSQTSIGGVGGMLYLIVNDSTSIGLDSNALQPVTMDSSIQIGLGTTSAPWSEIHGTTIYQNGKKVATLEDLAGVSGGGSGGSLAPSAYVKDVTWGHSSNRVVVTYGNDLTSEFSVGVVKQNVTSGLNQELPILTTMGSPSESLTSEVRFTNGMTINPSTGSITATSFKGTADKAVADADGNTISSTYAKASALNGRLPNYNNQINMTNGGNPRQVKFISVNYNTAATYFKMGAMCCHDNGISYQFLEDIIIGVTTGGVVTCNVYKYCQVENTLDGVVRQYGDVFYTIDTTNKVVDFYILIGQYSVSQYTPPTKIGNTTIAYVTPMTGSPVYYSSGEKVWAHGNDALIATTADLPKITYSTSEPPSTLADGEIWLVYE